MKPFVMEFTAFAGIFTVIIDDEPFELMADEVGVRLVVPATDVPDDTQLDESLYRICVSTPREAPPALLGDNLEGRRGTESCGTEMNMLDGRNGDLHAWNGNRYLRGGPSCVLYHLTYKNAIVPLHSFLAVL